MLPDIEPIEPTVIPAKTYDKYWVEEVNISAPDVNGDAVARIRLKKFGVFDGVAEFMPGDNGFNMYINDILSKSAQDNDLANIVQSLLLYIKKAGIEQGLVAPPPSGV
jgi:hypothetical protein